KWNEVTNVFRSLGTTLMNAARTLWNMLPEEFRRGVEKAVNWLRSLPQKAKEQLATAGSWLVESGKALVRGFIRGIRDMFPGLSGAIDGLMSLAKGFFPHSPAKWGPFSGQGWIDVGEGGSALVDEFASGFGAR